MNFLNSVPTKVRFLRNSFIALRSHGMTELELLLCDWGLGEEESPRRLSCLFLECTFRSRVGVDGKCWWTAPPRCYCSLDLEHGEKERAEQGHCLLGHAHLAWSFWLDELVCLEGWSEASHGSSTMDCHCSYEI